MLRLLFQQTDFPAPAEEEQMKQRGLQAPMLRGAANGGQATRSV
jgi:hypothetical protein